MNQREYGRGGARSYPDRQKDEGREGRLTTTETERGSSILKNGRHPVECNICYILYEIYVSDDLLKSDSLEREADRKYGEMIVGARVEPIEGRINLRERDAHQRAALDGALRLVAR